MMTDAKYEAKHAEKGGSFEMRPRPSTGYAFDMTEEEVEDIADALFGDDMNYGRTSYSRKVLVVADAVEKMLKARAENGS